MRRPTLVAVGDGGASDAGAFNGVNERVSEASMPDDEADIADAERYQQLFHGHFATMTRLAAMLGADDPEDVAQEAFVRLHRRRRTLRDPHARSATCAPPWST